MKKTRVRAFGTAATTLLAVRLLAVDGVWANTTAATRATRRTGRNPTAGC